MNLPVVLDIAIGLVFIYLIASLLASEIQELVSTILQWRAKHLRESIQNLLSGGYGTAKDEQLGGFIEAIYGDPLIKNMNQSARGTIGSLGQWVYRNVFYRGHSVFGRETSAPSYISSETFATALLERIGMETLIEKLTEIRLEKFIGRIIGQYEVQEEGSNRLITIPTEEFFQDKDYREKGAVRVLAEKAKTLSHDSELGITASTLLSLSSNEDFVALVEEYDDVLRDFRSGEAELETCVERMKEGLDIYINQVGEKILTSTSNSEDAAIEGSLMSDLEKQQLSYFKKRLISLKTGTFGDGTERAIASGRLRPTLLEIAQVFDRASLTYQEIEGAYKDIAAAYATGMMSQKIELVVDAINQQIDYLKTNARNHQKSGLNQLLPQPMTIGDLAEEQYQPAIDQIVQTLPVEERQIYKEWQTYQQGFTKIVRAIAEQLQSQGKLLDNGVELTQPVAEINLETLRQSVAVSFKQLPQEDFRLVDQSVLAQLTPFDQQTYRGWCIYQQIILEVTRDLAVKLQEEDRLFSFKTKTEFRESLAEWDDSHLYQSVKYSLNLMSNEERQLRINAAIRQLLTDQRQIYRNFQTYEQIQDLLAGVPTSVKQSLAILARRAQVKVGQTKDQLNQFNIEVSKWFDRSMSRASGVYKRNAKGVAIIIGFLIALFSNADTFHVIARLSGDDDLRQIITARASGITQNAKSEDLYSRQQLRDLKQNTDAILQEISLPLRWTPENLSQQFNCRSAANPAPAVTSTNPRTPWQAFYATCLNEEAPERFDLFKIGRIAFRPENMIDAGRMFLGWMVSGIAIAMGAPFWFDLMSKIMNVRNTGSKPAPATDKEPSKTT
ncbi:MAG: hypothetical protein IGS48_21415 [Oscillatoriales cyanobacterium C42_A2020_001]|nr:hypothetical protein [Leptolyngbyaceae cyanobacterium C42_A2020_001]